MKRCSKCGEEKPLEEFWRERSTRDGRATRCAPCFRAVTRASYHRNRARRIEYKKGYRDANRDSIAAAWKTWYENNREERLAYTRAWNDANPEKKRAARDPEKMAIDAHLRRARKAAVASERYTRQEIYDRDDGLCRGCGCDLPGYFEIDHIVPISLGGPDTRANVQLMCRGCNRSKHARLEGQTHFAA